jgi:prepilin-type N-terminal cleavage/methylation domain-containing protein
MSRRHSIVCRSGFTMLETTVALGIFAIALILAAQLGTQSLAERQRVEQRLAAIEFADNILESARARSWAELTPEWAAAQRLPAELADRLLDPSLSVRVEAERDRPGVKRITVDLHWRHSHGVDARAVSLTAVFSDRFGGGKP